MLSRTPVAWLPFHFYFPSLAPSSLFTVLYTCILRSLAASHNCIVCYLQAVKLHLFVLFARMLIAALTAAPPYLMLYSSWKMHEGSAGLAC